MKFKIWSRNHEYRDLTDVRPFQLKELLGIWRRAASDGIPRQSDISPSDLREYAGNIALVDIEQEPSRARYLIVGKNLKKLLGKDPTKRNIEEVYPPSIAREVYEAFGKVVRSRKPSYYQRDFVVLGRSFGYFRLILPMTTADETVNRLLVGIYPTDENLTEARTWQSAAIDFYRRKKEVDAQEQADIGDIWTSTLDL